MTLIRNDERAVVTAVAALVDCNPFLPERVELVQRILGDAFVRAAPVWHADGDVLASDPNLEPLRQRITGLAHELRRRLDNGARPDADEVPGYCGLALYAVWLRYEDDWYALVETHETGAALKSIQWYTDFERDLHHFFDPVAAPVDAAHFFALGFQLRRAFHHIFRKLFGSSLPAARLRAAVWRSIFSRDAARYRAVGYKHVGDIPTLILGESGTGKELVARAIGLSQYIPFAADSRSFAAELAGYCAVNLSELNPSLIEAELFGHRRGAFTGAVDDWPGWLESCGPHGAVFLDEIGEIKPSIQVKLLRVLQNRTFQRVGERQPRRFTGKVIAATNRDLQDERHRGRFRHDLFHRIYADVIRTPTLREQLADTPGDLRGLIGIVARQVTGEDAAPALADEVQQWLAQHLDRDHAWDGNMRELGHCVRSIFIHGEYVDTCTPAVSVDPFEALAADVRKGKLGLKELDERYCKLVYERSDSIEEAAKRLRIHRRTLRRKLGLE